MLSTLSIRNIAVISQADIGLKHGLNVFTGETGAGKTTIINLLMRFYDVDSGAIYVDGKDIVMNVKVGDKIEKDSLVCCNVFCTVGLFSARPGACTDRLDHRRH